MKLDQNSAECFIYTTREGALSPIGHDLKLKVTQFSLDLDGDKVAAEFATDSIKVVGAMHGDSVDLNTISNKDKSKIEKNLNKDVLKSKKHKFIQLAGTVERDDGSLRIDGKLTIMGKTAPVNIASSRVGDTWVSKTTINQSDWGMPQFKAILGQLRVAQDVVVEVRIPAAKLD